MRLRKDEFRAYLKRNLETGFDTASNESCPIACFLTRKEDFDVDVNDADIFIDGFRHEVPRWVQAFIKKWDTTTAKWGLGARALQILEGLQV